MRRSWTMARVALCSSLVFGAAAADGGTTKTVEVDCSRGESINAALQQKSEELIIEISGICREDVSIRRDNVTLRGIDPSLDVIEAVDGVFGNYGVHVRDAYGIRLENLAITNAEVGLRTDNSKYVSVVNCLLQGNQRAGAQIFGDSEVEMQSTVISGNGSVEDRTGIGLQVSGSNVSCTGCTLANNGSLQVFNDKSGRTSLDNSELSGWRGVLGYPASLTFGIDSIVTTTSWALDSVEADVTWQGGEIGGSIAAGYGGVLDLYGATQTSHSRFANYIYEGGLIAAQGRNGHPSVLIGTTYLDNFSRGFFYGDGGVELEDLVCDSGGEAVCAGSVPKNSSSCARCPLCTDADGDGYFAEEGCGTPVDCADGDPDAHPDAEELCEDGIDNDCDGFDAECPPPCIATTDADYVLSGGPDPDAGIFVDDFLRVWLEGTLIAEVSCCTPADPVVFAAHTGDELRLQAQDGNVCYSLSALFLQKADGSCLSQLTEEIHGPNCGSEPPEQVFFDETVILP